ncbi:type I restriction enzyme specificity protein [Burkholderia pseudomallei]|uniref:restriction endonuclease subunit S n=1 Tax=Burkholderia pseudomallei TaxID=28450 RepID=UPI0005DF89D1|nr:restriction endonuclease subunit S [Burkholderia pseudomallei]QUN86054.1 restriction endonuclease subunit S [Burkholderia pseudomallei]CPH57367.1 type I restriction enzyme specificity protein [Burkholderia pseudomallei]
MSYYKPYPVYKDTGIEWLGAVPRHWAVLRLKQVLTEQLSYGANAAAEDDDRSNPRFIRITDLNEDGALREETFKSLPPSTAKPYMLRSGDLLLARSGATVGKSFIYWQEMGPACYAGYLIRARLDKNKCLPKYCWFITQSQYYWGFIGETSIQATIQNVSGERYANLWLALPSIDEQQAIVVFLEAESARIQALIEKKIRFIELLREKRQAIITHAVTKGLDPNVPMKDSGVEWLGEVPEHWTVLSFQRRVYIAEGQVNPEEQPYADMMLIAPNHIESGTGRLLYTETAAEQMAESGKYLCREGDVIYSKIRPALRKACIAPADCLCSADMYPLRGDESLLNHYLLWFLLSEPFSAFAVLEADRVAMPKINRESLNALKLALPPVEEQEQISRMLTRATTRIDALVEKTERSIELLKEHRSALITAAVTGQIDLRATVAATSQTDLRKTA